VAGIDPGTVSLDVCVMDDGVPVLERSYATRDLAAEAQELVGTLRSHGPFDLVLGPAGYGLPLVPGAQLDDAALSLIVLVRADERGRDQGVVGLRGLIRALVAGGLPLVFGPGVIHLPTVPGRRKHNRIDLGTADKVAAVASAIEDQATRLGVGYEQTSFILLDLGGAFTAAIAVDAGQIVDGLGGTSGPAGARACGALDGEVAYLLAPRLRKATLFSGGLLAAGDELEPAQGDPAAADRRLAYEEAAAKAVLALTAVVPRPREILLTGRMARTPGLAGALGRRLAHVAPVRPGGRGAAHGAALIADGLAGGRHAPLVDRLRLREASGTALDHLTLAQAGGIALA